MNQKTDAPSTKERLTPAGLSAAIWEAEKYTGRVHAIRAMVGHIAAVEAEAALWKAEWEQISATAKELQARLALEPTGVVDEGKLWSFLSSVLRQGMAIQRDIADYPTSEHLSAHMDEAARKRTEEFMRRCATTAPLAARTECPYCHAPTDGSGGILHTYPCAGLQEVRISRLRLDWLRAHPESVAYEFSETKAGSES